MTYDHEAIVLRAYHMAEGNILDIAGFMDSFAEDGVYFPNFYSEAPVCIPARAILQTGILPHHSGIINNGDVLPEENEAET